jgi:hypothetical protein
MTITWEWQVGAHYNVDSMLYEFGASTVMYEGIGITTGKTGPNSYTYGYYTYYAKKATTASVQKRTGVHVTLYKPASGTCGLFSMRDASANVLVGIRIKSDGDLALYVGAVEQDTYTGVTLGVWRHLGLDAKIDASAGWAVVYLEGVEIMRYEGNTGAANVEWLYWGGSGTASPSFSILFDDWYCEDTAGQGSAALVPMRQFYPMTLSGNGYYNGDVGQFTGSDTDKVNNYLHVDDVLPDEDTTYVYAVAADIIDTYATTNYTLLAGMTVNAVHPYIIAKKTGTAAIEVAPFLREDSVDWGGVHQLVNSDYTLHIERRTTDPAGAVWDQTSINGLETGMQSEGAYT